MICENICVISIEKKFLKKVFGFRNSIQDIVRLCFFELRSVLCSGKNCYSKTTACILTLFDVNHRIPCFQDFCRFCDIEFFIARLIIAGLGLLSETSSAVIRASK